MATLLENPNEIVTLQSKQLSVNHKKNFVVAEVCWSHQVFHLLYRVTVPNTGTLFSRNILYFLSVPKTTYRILSHLWSMPYINVTVIKLFRFLRIKITFDLIIVLEIDRRVFRQVVHFTSPSWRHHSFRPLRKRTHFQKVKLN